MFLVKLQTRVGFGVASAARARIAAALRVAGSCLLVAVGTPTVLRAGVGVAPTAKEGVIVVARAGVVVPPARKRRRTATEAGVGVAPAGPARTADVVATVGPVASRGAAVGLVRPRAVAAAVAGEGLDPATTEPAPVRGSAKAAVAIPAVAAAAAGPLGRLLAPAAVVHQGPTIMDVGGPVGVGAQPDSKSIYFRGPFTVREKNTKSSLMSLTVLRASAGLVVSAADRPRRFLLFARPRPRS